MCSPPGVPEPVQRKIPLSGGSGKVVLRGVPPPRMSGSGCRRGPVRTLSGRPSLRAWCGLSCGRGMERRRRARGPARWGLDPWPLGRHARLGGGQRRSSMRHRGQRVHRSRQCTRTAGRGPARPLGSGGDPWWSRGCPLVGVPGQPRLGTRRRSSDQAVRRRDSGSRGTSLGASHPPPRQYTLTGLGRSPRWSRPWVAGSRRLRQGVCVPDPETCTGMDRAARRRVRACERPRGEPRGLVC